MREGGRPPWSDVAPAARRLTLAEVRARCADLPVPSAPDRGPGRRAAAVLVPLFEEGGEARLVLTVRPETMPSHQGQVAFPGGKVEPSVDSGSADAALREAEEEIGLRPEQVEVIAALDPVATVVGMFTVEPFVGLLEGRPRLAPDTREVARVFDVALSELYDEDVWREEQWSATGGDWRPIHFFELAGETVWGLTAHILSAFLAHLVGVDTPGSWRGPG